MLHCTNKTFLNPFRSEVQPLLLQRFNLGREIRGTHPALARVLPVGIRNSIMMVLVVVVVVMVVVVVVVVVVSCGWW